MRIGYVMKLDMIISNADFLLDIIKGTERVKTANTVPAMWMVHLWPSVWTSWTPQQYGQCHALGNSPLSLSMWDSPDLSWGFLSLALASLEHWRIAHNLSCKYKSGYVFCLLSSLPYSLPLPAAAPVPVGCGLLGSCSGNSIYEQQLQDSFIIPGLTKHFQMPVSLSHICSTVFPDSNIKWRAID